MDKLTRQAENEKFHEWYLKSGYHYKPETDEEGDWVVGELEDEIDKKQKLLDEIEDVL